MNGRAAVGARSLGRRRFIHFAAIIAGAVLVALWGWSGTAWAASASVVHKGPSGSKQIALTFDDNSQTTRALATLRALEKYNVPATLFLIGSATASTPSINAEIIKGMNAGLFEVGDHSWSHPVLTGLSAAALAAQIGGGTDTFHALTGARTVPLFRPPYGSYDSRVAAAAGSEGFKHLVLWDVDPRDWDGKSASAIANHVISRAHGGAIVVMHLSAAHTAAAIPTIVSTLRAKGYEFVKVSTMLKGQRLFLDVDEATEVGAAIAIMAKQGFMSGYDGNYFGPEDTITRAQVAKVATLVGGLHTTQIENVETPSFSDVPPVRVAGGGYREYPFDFVQEAAAAGLVQGSVAADGSAVFRPNETITRLQLASILARMVRALKGYPGDPATTTTTIGGGTTTSGNLTTTSTSPGGTQPPATLWSVPYRDVPQYAVADVGLVVSLGLMTGYSGEEFRAWAGAKRSQVALAMSRYLALAPFQPAD